MPATRRRTRTRRRSEHLPLALGVAGGSSALGWSLHTQEIHGIAATVGKWRSGFTRRKGISASSYAIPRIDLDQVHFQMNLFSIRFRS